MKACEDHPMAQQHPYRRVPAAADSGWLSMLVATFEAASRADNRGVPCDAAIIAGLKAQLARPATFRGEVYINTRTRN